MTTSFESTFKHNYQTHLKHLKLKGLQPKTIEAYARAIRRVGEYFDEQIDDLSEAQGRRVHKRSVMHHMNLLMADVASLIRPTSWMNGYVGACVVATGNSGGGRELRSVIWSVWASA